METHRLRNLLHPDLLRERLKREARERTTLSFYRYVRLNDVEALRHALYAEWEQLGVLGRVYIAGEGVNAQVSLPTANLPAFRSALNTHEAFRDIPWKIAVEDDGKSFLKLIIKVRKKIVADGLTDDAFDVTNVGEHLDAERFNRKMEEGALVIDMRNNYECLIGHFEGAYLPKADTFRGAIEEVSEVLKGREAKEVLLYCTGGIRCEKASAYLKHHGFTRVNQLHGGIIDYARQIKDKGLASKYKGQNFDFEKCDIFPKITVVRKTEKGMDKNVSITNKDDNILHNPHGYAVKGANRKTLFNKPLPSKGDVAEVTKNLKRLKDDHFFLQCDQHNFMEADARVVWNPYYAVTGADGSFKLTDIPAGKYKVTAWHPYVGEVTQEVTVSGGADAAQNFELAAK